MTSENDVFGKDSARLAFHYRWSAWRRRHQARARWHHYSTRLTALAT